MLTSKSVLKNVLLVNIGWVEVKVNLQMNPSYYNFNNLNFEIMKFLLNSVDDMFPLI